MSNPPPVLETRNLVKVYGDGGEVRALDGVSFQLQPGEFTAIVGPSGAGKSTLLHLLGALDRPTSGDVILAGRALSQVRDLDRFRSETIGFVFQMHNLIPTLTAVENVEVPMAEGRLPGRQRRERARELLALVGLAKRWRFMPNQMSGGERQRVAIARALANRPAILLADEPTGNLDSKTTDEIMDLLTALNGQGTTLIVVTHNPQVAGAARRVITLRDGRVLSDLAFSSPFEKDLIELKHSTLGRALLTGDARLPAELQAAAPALRGLFEKV